jgi:hypothetical protein
MCTWPKGGKRADWEKHWQYGYFNECMSGFEYQAAGHMIWENMVTEGLAVARAIHDRYHAGLRNPYNEVECCDHYARAMASYGVFLAACGFEYHGPKGYLAFAPRLNPRDFRAAFTTAEGWGTFSQRMLDDVQEETIDIRYGRLRLKALGFQGAEGWKPQGATVTQEDEEVPAKVSIRDERIRIELDRNVVVEPERPLKVAIS